MIDPARLGFFPVIAPGTGAVRGRAVARTSVAGRETHLLSRHVALMSNLGVARKVKGDGGGGERVSVATLER